jgi:hypothetical protein
LVFLAVYGPCRSSTGVCVEYALKFSAAVARLMGWLAVAVLAVLSGVAEGFLNAPLGDGVLPVEALGVDLEQDGRAMTGPLGDLGGRDAAVELSRRTRAGGRTRGLLAARPPRRRSTCRAGPWPTIGGR